MRHVHRTLWNGFPVVSEVFVSSSTLLVLVRSSPRRVRDFLRETFRMVSFATQTKSVISLSDARMEGSRAIEEQQEVAEVQAAMNRWWTSEVQTFRLANGKDKWEIAFFSEKLRQVISGNIRKQWGVCEADWMAAVGRCAAINKCLFATMLDRRRCISIKWPRWRCMGR